MILTGLLLLVGAWFVPGLIMILTGIGMLVAGLGWLVSKLADPADSYILVRVLVGLFALYLFAAFRRKALFERSEG